MNILQVNQTEIVVLWGSFKRRLINVTNYRTVTHLLPKVLQATSIKLESNEDLLQGIL